MPKVLFLPKGKISYSGISIAWTKTYKRLDVAGWYDSYCGIQGSSLTLREFFDELGITEQDCNRAFKEDKK